MKYDFPFIVTKVLPSFFRDLCLIQSSEANFASLLYHHLVSSGVLPTNSVYRPLRENGESTEGHGGG